MEQITGTEAALFLLFLSANYKWDSQNYCLQGELTTESEQLILKCVNRLSFFEDISSQEMLEEAITKWDKFIRGSISTEDALEQIAEIIYKHFLRRNIFEET